MKYEIWKVKKGVMIEKITEFTSLETAWFWIHKQKDCGSYVIRCFNK